MRVAIVDDHAMARAGYRHMLVSHPEIEVVAEGSSGEDALRIAREVKPDVMILDVSMPGISGIEVTQRLAKADRSLAAHAGEELAGAAHPHAIATRAKIA